MVARTKITQCTEVDGLYRRVTVSEGCQSFIERFISDVDELASDVTWLWAYSPNSLSSKGYKPETYKNY